MGVQRTMRLAGATVVGLAGLLLEIAYTRVISYKLFYFYTYLVIGLALLGLGSASVAVAFSRRLRSIDSVVLMKVLFPVAGIVGMIAYWFIARVPSNFHLIWVGTGPQAVKQVCILLALSVALTMVFFALGLVLSSIIVVESHEMSRLYFWDLTGAAAACLVAIPLISAFGPPALIMGTSVALVGCGLAAAAVGRSHRIPTGALVLVAAVLAVPLAGMRITTDSSKSLTSYDVIEKSGWGPVFRVETIDKGPLKLLIHDGLTGSTIWRYDGTPATTDRFAGDSRRLPFAALGTPPERLLIIGAAGGNEIQFALQYGVGHIDAVELNPVTVRLLTHDYLDYSGRITEDPRVNYVRGDGRTYLARSTEPYDMIWFVAPDSYAANNAASSGAFVLSESYLYTKEMVEETMSHLSDRGVVVAQFGDFEFSTRPNRTLRYLVTARAAMGSDDFADRTMLVIDDTEYAIGRLSTIMLFKSPVGASESGRVTADISAYLPESKAIYLPAAVRDESITADVIVGDDAEVNRIRGGYDYDVSVIDDDRPFFWHFSTFSKVLTNLERNAVGTEIAIGERLILALVAIAIVVAGLLLWLPFPLSRRRGFTADRLGARSRGSLFTYFAALGFGFMMVEVSMMQRFALLLGYPTLSLSVSLCSLLVSAAVGARLSPRTAGREGSGIHRIAAVLSLLVLVYLLVSTGITDHALAWPSWARIATVVALLFPVGVVLGTFLPVGVAAATRIAASRSGIDEGRLVAWCWAVNGFFSVLGSSLTTIFSMTFGFNRTLVAGLVVYWAAVAALRLGRIGQGSAVSSS